MTMAFSPKVRKEMENLIYNFFSLLDPSGNNTTKYKNFFGNMSDQEFKKFFDDFFKDKSSYLTLDVVDYEHTLDIDKCRKASKFLNVPLYETVMLPNINNDGKGNIVTTKVPVPVGYIHMKTVQQMVRKKNSTSTSISSRDSRTGQVTGDDKDVQFSIDETYALMAYNAKACLKEFFSLRADDMEMKNEGYASIRKNGYVSMADLPDDIENKVAINTLDVYMTCMGLKTDIVNDGYILKKNLTKKGE